MKRVVVTGFAGLTPIGSDWDTVERNLRNRTSGISTMPEWNKFKGLHTRLAAPISDFEVPPHYSRKKVRSMGRVSQLAVRATELALQDAGLSGDPQITNGNMGVAYGSSTGSTDAIAAIISMIVDGSMKNVTATTYIKMMSNTAAVNIGVFFELKGRIIPTCSTCTSGSQGIGYAYESVKYGLQTMMVAGGAEELCPTEAAVFDALYATSTRNDSPEETPRPFDKDRDGLVIGEGAGTLILEELEHAKARGVRIHAEIVGYSCNSDGNHVTQPSSETMKIVMKKALEVAELPTSEIGYVSAHGTATERGDIAESQATQRLFGSNIPISSLKSYMGHTLGACGSIEAWALIKMLQNDWYAPTINLKNVDERCAELDYILGGGRNMQNEYVMSNNFAFGGINTSLVFKRWG